MLPCRLGLKSAWPDQFSAPGRVSGESETARVRGRAAGDRRDRSTRSAGLTSCSPPSRTSVVARAFSLPPAGIPARH